MIYLENDFYSNFNSMVESNDDLSLKSMFIDQVSIHTILIKKVKKDIYTLLTLILTKTK